MTGIIDHVKDANKISTHYCGTGQNDVSFETEVVIWSEFD